MFAFFGAGDASYYENASLTVIFAKPPSPATKKRIEKDIPKPLTRERWTKRTLFVATDDYVLAGKPSFAAFNAAIEKWLLACHAISPIDFALRAEDSEASTTFSAWHRDSMASSLALVSNFAKRYDDATTRAWARKTLLEMMKAAGVALPAKLDPTPSRPEPTKHGLDRRSLEMALLDGSADGQRAIDQLFARAVESPSFATLFSDTTAECAKAMKDPETAFALIDRLVEIDGHPILIEHALWAVEEVGPTTVSKARLDRYWTLAIQKLPDWERLRPFLERLAPALGRTLPAPSKKRR